MRRVRMVASPAAVSRAFEQRFAATRPPRRRSAASAARSAASRTPPDAWNAMRANAHALAYSAMFGPVKRAVAVDVGAQHVLEARGAVALDGRGAGSASRSCVQPWVAISGAPAASSRTSSAEREAIGAEFREPAATGVGVADGQAADDGARRTRCERVLEARARSNAAAELHLDARRRAHAPNSARFTGSPRFAPSRSTTCSHARAERRGTARRARRGRPRSESRVRSRPCSSRTQRPSRRSMAGINSMLISGYS